MFLLLIPSKILCGVILILINVQTSLKFMLSIYHQLSMFIFNVIPLQFHQVYVHVRIMKIGKCKLFNSSTPFIFCVIALSYPFSARHFYYSFHLSISIPLSFSESHLFLLCFIWGGTTRT